MKPQDYIVDGYLYDIFGACQDIHSSVSGSGDFVCTDEIVEALRRKLREWRPSALPAFAAYEDAVYALAVAALAEWDAYQNRAVR